MHGHGTAVDLTVTLTVPYKSDPRRGLQEGLRWPPWPRCFHKGVFQLYFTCGVDLPDVMDELNTTVAIQNARWREEISYLKQTYPLPLAHPHQFQDPGPKGNGEGRLMSKTAEKPHNRQRCLRETAQNKIRTFRLWSSVVTYTKPGFFAAHSRLGIFVCDTGRFAFIVTFHIIRINHQYCKVLIKAWMLQRDIENFRNHEICEC